MSKNNQESKFLSIFFLGCLIKNTKNFLQTNCHFDLNPSFIIVFVICLVRLEDCICSDWFHKILLNKKATIVMRNSFPNQICRVDIIKNKD